MLEAAIATGAVKALAHITGGGLLENVPRCSRATSMPSSTSARGRCRRCSGSFASWPRRSTTHELHRTLNMGIGMVVVCAPDDVELVQAAIDEETWVIGELVPTIRRVTGSA